MEQNVSCCVILWRTGRREEPETICTGTSWEHAHATDSIPEVPPPDRDPVFGEDGALLDRWHPR